MKVNYVLFTRTRSIDYRWLFKCKEDFKSLIDQVKLDNVSDQIKTINTANGTLYYRVFLSAIRDSKGRDIVGLEGIFVDNDKNAFVAKMKDRFIHYYTFHDFTSGLRIADVDNEPIEYFVKIQLDKIYDTYFES